MSTRSRAQPARPPGLTHPHPDTGNNRPSEKHGLLGYALKAVCLLIAELA